MILAVIAPITAVKRAVIGDPNQASDPGSIHSTNSFGPGPDQESALFEVSMRIPKPTARPAPETDRLFFHNLTFHVVLLFILWFLFLLLLVSRSWVG